MAAAEAGVTVQATDAPADDPASAAAPDAEGSMTPPRPRRGSSAPDAEKTILSPSSSIPSTPNPSVPSDASIASPSTAVHGAAPGGAPFAASGTPCRPSHGPQRGPGGTAEPYADQTVIDVLEPEESPRDGREQIRTLAVARVAGDPPPVAETTSPPLIPDAILPPGFTPEEPEEADAEPRMGGTRPTPTIGSGDAGGSYPGGPGTPPYGETPRTGRTALLIGGGALAALLLGGGTVIAYTTTADHTHRHPAVRQTPVAQPPPVPARPSLTPTPVRHRPKGTLVRVDIRDEKKDPVPLTPAEAFPAGAMKVAGRTFDVVKTVLNNHCDLTANGSFAAALTRQHCRSVVRATLLSDDKKIAVTAGIAAMPTDAAAIAAMKAQDPAHYDWFRGLKVDGAPKIDGPGGFAASTRRGRYICYAYVMYADGHKPKKGDKTLQQVGDGFRDAMVKPINRRARSKYREN